MENDEKYIHDHFGRNDHFVVPDGFFEQFAHNVMTQVPEQMPRRSMVGYVWLRYAAAASLLLLCGIAGLWFDGGHHEAAPIVNYGVAATHGNTVVSGSVEEVADYAMIDNEDMYSYIAGYE